MQLLHMNEFAEVDRRRAAVAPRIAAAAAAVIAPPIRWVDHALIAHYGIIEFTSDPDCLLRVALAPSPSAITLCDGTDVERGEVVAELHLWSERAMNVFRDGVSFRAGLALRRRMARSFTCFAQFSMREPRFATRAVLIRTTTCPQFPRETAAAFARRWGFELEAGPRSPVERFSDFWDNFYFALLGLAYPSGEKATTLRRRMDRIRVWISRERLLRFHLPAGHASNPA